MSSSFREVVQRHLGPPVNIEGIIRSLGIELDKKADLDPDISGQLERTSNGKYKISVNKGQHYFRQRFTMAHELGHYLLHADLIGEGVDDNTAYRSVPDGRFYNEAITPREETQANEFAARVLLPKSVILAHTTIGSSVRDLSKRLQASVQATAIRLSTLGFDVDGDTIRGLPPDHPETSV